jgi:putative ABC transport system permease protein
MGHRPIFPALFVLSTAVGIASLLALVSVGAAVKKVVVEHARELWAADITVKGSPPLLASTEGWVNVRWPGVRTARTVDSLSMARLRSGQAFQVSVSALSSNYPLYGKITTRSGRPLQDVLRPGWVVVGENLLARWHVSLGDEIRLGESRFRVADALVSRTDAPVSFFELSPTVLLTLDDLTSSRLLSPGSRSLNVLYINLPSEVDFESALADVKRHTVEESAEVSGWSTDNPGVFRFLQNVLDNLDFLALLTLLLGGLGAATALSAARAAATRDIGTLFALGAPRGFVLRSWAVWIGTLTAAGVLLALPVGQGVARVLLLR